MMTPINLACGACTRVHLVNLTTGKVSGGGRRLDRPGARLASSVGRGAGPYLDH